MSKAIVINNQTKSKMVSTVSNDTIVKSNGAFATYITQHENGEEPSTFEIAVISQKRAIRLGRLRKAILKRVSI